MGLGVYLSFMSHSSTNYLQIGDLLLKRMLLTIPKARSTRCDFVQLDACLHEENPANILAMEKALHKWENNHSHPDPYCLPKSSELYSDIVCAICSLTHS